jgi:hypothetical protein
MSTGRLSELSVENEVRFTGNGMFFVTTISKITGGVVGFYDLMVGVPGPKIRQEFSSE